MGVPRRSAIPGEVLRPGYEDRCELRHLRDDPLKPIGLLELNHMRRFIITGAPGAGKTAIIRQLELDGFSVVEEAATDVIAAAQAHGTVELWRHPSFIDAIAHLQKDRQIRASHQPDEVQFHDRSVVCTAALAVYLGYPISPFLAGELERVKKEATYQK